MTKPTHRPNPQDPEASTAGGPEGGAEDPGGLTHVFDFAEKATKVAGVLAVFGYIALRSHLNYLGVSAPVSLGFERYLVELWSLVGVTIPLLVLVLAAKLVSVPTRLLYRRLRRNAGAKTAQEAPGGRHAPAWMFSAAAIGNIVLFLLWGSAVDVVVGSLSPEAVRRSEWSIFIFWLLLAICVGGYSVFLTRPRDQHPPGDSWTWAGLALFVLILQLSVFYGRSVRSTEYPLARVVPADSTHSQVCGLLLLQTDSEVKLWRASRGVGEVLTLPRDGIASVRTGEVLDVLALADSSVADTLSNWPRCPPLYAPSTREFPLPSR